MKEIKTINKGIDDLGTKNEPAKNPRLTWARTNGNGLKNPKKYNLTQPSRGGGTRRILYEVCDHQPLLGLTSTRHLEDGFNKNSITHQQALVWRGNRFYYQSKI